MDPTFQYAGKVRIPPKEFQLRARIEDATRNTVNIKHYDHWRDDTPDFTLNIHKKSGLRVNEVNILTGYEEPIDIAIDIPYMDMAPMNTRTDSRDFRQSQPYVAGGPDLQHNAYFDRYDPVSDPRNAVRELRSAVYEDKGTSRGINESQRMLRRQFEHRWTSEEIIDDDLMDTYLRYEIATSGKNVTASADIAGR